jgi:hypothetical protein
MSYAFQPLSRSVRATERAACFNQPARRPCGCLNSAAFYRARYRIDFQSSTIESGDGQLTRARSRFYDEAQSARRRRRVVVKLKLRSRGNLVE